MFIGGEGVPRVEKPGMIRITSNTIHIDDFVIVGTSEDGVMRRKPLKKGKRLRPVSRKMAPKLVLYYKARGEYMHEHPWCEICLVLGQKRLADDLHHKKGRGKHLCDKRYFSSLCRPHHTFVHDHPDWARKAGWLISKFK